MGTFSLPPNSIPPTGINKVNNSGLTKCRLLGYPCLAFYDGACGYVGVLYSWNGIGV